MSRRLLDNLNIPPEMRKTDYWPPITVDGLEPGVREKVRRRIKAVRLYVETNKPIEEIKSECGISDDEIRRLVKRCFSPDPDGSGNIIGFRALLMGQRISEYTRRKKPQKGAESQAPGAYAGAFKALLHRFPEIAKFIDKKALGLKTDSGPPERHAAIVDIHTQVLAKLRKLGIKENEYPLNTKSKGYDALRRYIGKLIDKHATRYTKNRLADRNQRIQPLPQASRRKLLYRPFERVELDAQTQDCHLAIDVPTPEGMMIKVPMERMSAVMVIERASRAVLGYELAFGRNYNSDDVDMALTNAIVVWKPMQLTIPDLTYPPGAGLPSGVIPECAFRLWDQIGLDNAMAHKATSTHQQLTEVVRCAVNLGQVATPESRIIMERFFGTITRQIQRLPSTTGSHPQDSRRTDSEGNAVKYGVTFEYLSQVFDVIVAKYNVTPHSGLPGQMTPLSYLREALAQGDLSRQVFEEERTNFSLCKSSLRVTIRGNMKKGKRPYIQHKNAIYTNAVIADTPSLINTTVIAEINKRDARTMNVFLTSGEFLGVVQAIGPWGIYKHSLRQRELVTRRFGMRHLAFDGDSEIVNPMDALLRHLGKEAGSSKKSASKYAELLFNLGENGPSQLHQASQPKLASSQAISRGAPVKSDEFDESDPIWRVLGGTVID